ncbi:MAG: T9SS C-terminal target domain-containing protein [Calditrichaeota bacterium]|nr:MAG: T9SS C-terminal target domain-containing protein [Calditrichota bacterium]
MHKHTLFRLFLLSVLLFSFSRNVFSGGKVYLVIGSDTAIWSRMDVAQYNNTYDQSLYTDPLRNAYTVMDPAFRADLLDSFGQPMKMTWWMMAGNIFRYATNTNVPVPNIMTLYLMKKYHGENVLATGDELSLHYHTFLWSDYDQDGTYYWNQAKSFLESLDDFKVTLAQFLLEEKVFPVSFRSGWHYMDNDWQRYLDERVLPYSMHNDYPGKRTEDLEPINNLFDWSEAPSTFIPYHPSTENYQIPGDGPGWQLRSVSFQRAARIPGIMESIFAAAEQGTDQVACFWAHLPEADFPENMQMIDSLAHAKAALYPEVKFQYCTAIEAMQLWRNNEDFAAPEVQFSDAVLGDAVYFNIESDETIFQQQPFVAIKNIYEQYLVLECEQTGANQWQTRNSVPLKTLAKAGVTVCDTMGNQAMKFISYLPDDVFIDNVDAGYAELQGDWNNSSTYSWGTDSRIITLAANDSAQVSWNYPVPQSRYYNVFIQFPDVSNRANELRFLISNNHMPLDTIITSEVLPAKKWIFLSTVDAESGSEINVEMSAAGKNQAGKQLVADVLKITPLVRGRDIEIKKSVIELGAVSVEDSLHYVLEISNTGIDELQISELRTFKDLIFIDFPVPFTIPPMSSIALPLTFISQEMGMQTDLLEIYSDDPVDSLITLRVSADVKLYFCTIDNEDRENYEEFGDWRTSVATIYGPTSRYAHLNETPLASARFYTTLKKSGTYDILQIVPSTVNSTDDALYEIIFDSELHGSFHVNQNNGSGDWVTIGTSALPANKEIELWIKDTGNSTTGVVIRTDAVRFQLVEEHSTGVDAQTEQIAGTFRLEQNYPNPFNPVTTIKFNLPQDAFVTLNIFNNLGHEIKTLINENRAAGLHSITFDGSDLASGVYFYKLSAGKFSSTKKFLLLK